MFFKIIFILLAIFSLKTFSDAKSQRDLNAKENEPLISKQLQVIKNSINSGNLKDR